MQLKKVGVAVVLNWKVKHILSNGVDGKDGVIVGVGVTLGVIVNSDTLAAAKQSAPGSIMEQVVVAV